MMSFPLQAASLGLSGGIGSQDILQNFVRVDAPQLNRSLVAVVMINQLITNFGPYLSLEAEAQFGKHFEIQSAETHPYEWNTVGILRWNRLPWYQILPGSFAFGNGLSYVSAIPQSENLHTQGLSKWLYYILLEFAFDLSANNEMSFLFRIHHRSGVFGVFTDLEQGSNYLCMGLRMQI